MRRGGDQDVSAERCGVVFGLMSPAVGLAGFCRPSPRHEQAPNIFNSQRLWTGCIQSWTCASERLLKKRSSKSFKVQ